MAQIEVTLLVAVPDDMDQAAAGRRVVEAAMDGLAPYNATNPGRAVQVEAAATTVRPHRPETEPS